jgi:hypothetical protein
MRANDIQHSAGNYVLIKTSFNFIIHEKGTSFKGSTSSVDGTNKRALRAAIAQTEIKAMTVTNMMTRSGLISHLLNIASGRKLPAQSSMTLMDEIEPQVYPELADEVASIIRKWSKYSGYNTAPVPAPASRFRSKLALESSTYEERFISGQYAELNLELFDYVANKLGEES